MTVLYVDDDAEDREFFQEAITTVNPSITCLTAINGLEAMKMLDEDDGLPEQIFLDINMPVMDGKKCLFEIKNNQRLKHIPVIMYSTTSHTNEIKECYRLGAFDFLIKPHDFDKLCEDLTSIFVQLKRDVRLLD